MLEAQITRSSSHFDALHTRYDAIESAVNAYSLASFNAAKEASKKQRDAAVKEITDNSKAEKDAKEKEKDHYDNIVKPAEKEREQFPAPPEYDGLIVKPLPFIISDYEDWLNDFNTIAIAFKTTNTQTVAAKPARDSAMNNAINAAKLNNENTRKETDKQAQKEYTNNENTGWNDYYSAVTAAESAYFTSYQRTENTFNTTKKQADNAYDDTVIPAYLTYSQQLREYETLFTAAVASAGNPGFDANAYFNGSKQNDYNVVMAKQQGGGNQNPYLPAYSLMDVAVPELFLKITPDMHPNQIAYLADQFITTNQGLWNDKPTEHHAFLNELARRKEYYYINKEHREQIERDLKAKLKEELDEQARLQRIADYQIEKAERLAEQLREEEEKRFKENVMFGVHTTLDVLGFVPVFGELFDGANGVIYLVEGNYVDASLSFVGMVPFYGWFVTGGKWGKKVLHAADTGGNLAGGAGKITVEAMKSFSTKEIDEVVALTMKQKGNHIFANKLHPKPWLNQLSTQMGGDQNVIKAALENANGRIKPNAQGIFDTPVEVGGVNFVIRGYTKDGTTVINSIYIPIP